LIEAARHYPVVTLTGPRQSGKTTLCRSVLPDKRYVTLEQADVREYATRDPRGFLAEYRAGAILDEIQHVPDLLGYLKAEVDERPEHGRFVLTGSQHLGLTRRVSESLAGRTAVLHLLPPSLDELRRFPDPPSTLLGTLWSGAYPRIHDRGIPADRWLADYASTYLHRDVRDVLAVGDLGAFTRFLRLCAGRTGQVVNLSALGADAGISHNTARSWLSVLEATFVVLVLPAWHRNIKKQLTRAPKLHFLDSGLACHLLGIRSPDELAHHPLRGPLFESWVAAEACKAQVHRGRPVALHHFRDHKGLEVDLVVDCGARVTLVETKSGATVATDFLAPLRRVGALAAAADPSFDVTRRLVYGGTEALVREGVDIVPWSAVASARWD
jgi:predicted AAA+ superfamily ATPase